MTPEQLNALILVLNYVEMWNKEDDARDVADAAFILQEYLDKEEIINDKIKMEQYDQ